ncbi:HlyD family secretion protein [Tropicimonas sp. S265A]|uniref:HlyD family secretion protein n=1 Tax=Tropicimonas sp. S265A TaxID=3415134 RepID=UPI003C7E8D03
MLELTICSLLTILPDYLYRSRVQGKRIGHEITLYSVWFELRWGITGCVLLTTTLITMIFYFHPSTSQIVSVFRTVTILPETPGRVVEVLVANDDRVEAGQVLFRLDDAVARTNLETAQARLAEIDASVTVAEAQLAAANGSVDQAQGALTEAEQEFRAQSELLARGSGAVSVRQVEELGNAVDAARGALQAAVAGRDAVQAQLDEALPAQRVTALAALDQAQVLLDQTEVKAGVEGRVEQFALRPGDFVSAILRPAGILVPDVEGDREFVATFDQISAQVVQVGSVAEMTCLAKPFAIIPMRVTDVQPEVPSGQFRPTDNLLDGTLQRAPGRFVAQLKPIWPEQVADIPRGANCFGNVYTVPPHGSGALMHIVGTTGVVHAAGLRLRALLLPVRTLVLTGDH